MNYKWDGCDGEEIKIRIMLLGDIDDVKSLLKKEGKIGLKEVFLKNTHRFFKQNRSFWQLVLGVSDEEFERETKKGFRNASTLRHFI